MPSTPLRIPQVVSRRFTYFRVVKNGILAVQRDFCAGFDYGDSTKKWLARAMSPGRVCFPINHAWREDFIYYIDHLPQVEELGERT